MMVPCECGAKLKIDDAKVAGRSIKVRCPRCATVITVPAQSAVAAATSALSPVSAPKTAPSTGAGGSALILVAHDSEVIRTMITSVLTDEGFRVDAAADGIEALKKVTENKPHGMILDVGLPGIYGFELCERLKGDPATSSLKIILLSSVYDMRRYKRTPVNLYGADDYIEKHHIPDHLGEKFRKLIYPERAQPAPEPPKGTLQIDLPEMSRPPAREFAPSMLSADKMAQAEEANRGSAPPQLAAQPAVAQADRAEKPITPESFSLEASIFQREELNISRVEETDPDAVEKAQRFARIIVSDIALYNQEAVIEGIKNGNFYELLKADIQEGRDLYEKRVPGAIKTKKDYFREAFDNFVATAQRKIVH